MIGNDWEFTIEKASATIELPPGAKVLSNTAYTGPKGAKGSDYIIRRNEKGNTTFSTTRALNPGAGITIAVYWPKGFVREPNRAEKITYFLKDNGSAIVGLIGFIMLLIYFLATWAQVGKDPQKGVIIPQYEPPKGFSPSAVRYIMHMGFD